MSKPNNDPARQPLPLGPESIDMSAAAAIEAGEAEISKLRADLDDANDRVLRCQAEFDNVRKRLRREMEDDRRYSILPLLDDLLPVLDNLHRAISAAEKSSGDRGLLDGVKMVAQTLIAALAKHGCQRIDALHKPFDPTYHQAISQQPSAEYPPGTVILVAQDGYRLHDRVVRPAQVIVSASPNSLSG
jgi:molecular chaperone GrpE